MGSGQWATGRENRRFPYPLPAFHYPQNIDPHYYMEKNTVFAFLLIFVTLLFFSSPTWTRKIAPALGLAPKVTDTIKTPAAPPPPPVTKDKGATAPAPPPAAAAPPSLAPAAPADTSPGQIFIVETDLYRGVIQARGGVITSWRIKSYKDTAGNPVEIMPEGSRGALGLTLKEKLPLDGRLFASGREGDTVRLDARAREQALALECRDSAAGWAVCKEFTFRPGRYDVGLALAQSGLENEKLRLHWGCGIRGTEPLEKGSAIMGGGLDYSEAFLKYGDDVERTMSGGDKRKQFEGNTKWLSTKGKYFEASVIYGQEASALNVFERLENAAQANQKNNFGYSTEFRAAGERTEFQVYLGPVSYRVLRGYGIRLEKTLFQGYGWFLGADQWWPPLCGLLVRLLNLFHGLLPNFGVAIILLTILVRTLMFPLTLKQSRSMLKMKAFQPEMQAIRDKYKSDPMKANQAIMQMYREKGINPLTQGFGCVPMLLQMPIFIALYNTLRYAIELRNQPFVLWINNLGGPEVMFHHYLPFAIPLFGNTVSLLNIIMAISTYWQSKQTITDPKQKFMLYFMPGFMFLAMNSLPSGLLLYWTVSNILGIGQNLVIQKWFNRPGTAAAGAAGPAAAGRAKVTMDRPVTSLKEILEQAKHKRNQRDPMNRMSSNLRKFLKK